MNGLNDHDREAISRVAASHGATDVRVFGSIARGRLAPPATLIFSSSLPLVEVFSISSR